MNGQTKESEARRVDARTVAEALRVLLDQGIEDGEGGLDNAIDLLLGRREDKEPLLTEALSFEDAGLLTRDHGHYRRA